MSIINNETLICENSYKISNVMTAISNNNETLIYENSYKILNELTAFE